MQTPSKEIPIELPADVDIRIDGDEVTVSGEHGDASRTFAHPKLEIQLGDPPSVLIESPRRKDLALAKTWASHITNMAGGVTEPFSAKLKIVYSHFPIKAKVEGDEFVVENFLGERAPRTARILGDVDVEIDGDEVTVEGFHKEEVGQTAANIEDATSTSGYDPRVFQDGIYITEKPR